MQGGNSWATLRPSPADLLVASPSGNVILRVLRTGVGEGGRVLLKEVPGVLYLASVWPVQAQIRPTVNSD